MRIMSGEGFFWGSENVKKRSRRHLPAARGMGFEKERVYGF